MRCSVPLTGIARIRCLWIFFDEFYLMGGRILNYWHVGMLKIFVRRFDFAV